MRRSENFARRVGIELLGLSLCLFSLTGRTLAQAEEWSEDTFDEGWDDTDDEHADEYLDANCAPGRAGDP